MAMNIVARFDRPRRAGVILVSLALVLSVGVFDYLTRTEFSLVPVYLAPVSLSAWFLGARFATIISLLSSLAWASGGWLSRDDDFSPTSFVFWWNGGWQLVSFLALVWTLATLRRLQRDLEERVRARAAKLTEEIAERERLRLELLEISEREQRRIGQDLHDGLGQHLAATAFASQVLGEKLASMGLAEAKDARAIAALVQRAVGITREHAKGLFPLEFEADGLMDALDELAASTSERQRTHCRFECGSPVLIDHPAAAAHLFRIAQEAVRNAVRHGKANQIVIRLDTLDEGHLLAVEDDGAGIGLPTERAQGMGLRIMAHRIRAIGGSMTIDPRARGGTIVSFTFPSDPRPAGLRP